MLKYQRVEFIRACFSSFSSASSSLPAPDRSGYRRTSTGDVRITVGTAGPKPATSGVQWALPGLNGKTEGQRECQKLCPT